MQFISNISRTVSALFIRFMWRVTQKPTALLQSALRNQCPQPREDKQQTVVRVRESFITQSTLLNLDCLGCQLLLIERDSLLSQSKLILEPESTASSIPDIPGYEKQTVWWLTAWLHPLLPIDPLLDKDTELRQWNMGIKTTGSCNTHCINPDNDGTISETPDINSTLKWHHLRRLHCTQLPWKLHTSHKQSNVKVSLPGGNNTSHHMVSQQIIEKMCVPIFLFF
jgi:hypothetical protein